MKKLDTDFLLIVGTYVVILFILGMIMIDIFT